MLIHQVTHFLDFFAQAKGGSKNKINTFCWMDESSSAVVKGRSAVFGKLKHVVKWAAELESSGVKLPTLHITLNETDLEGRRSNNIKAYRVLCCDLDRKITRDELLSIYKKYAVQMVVQSSTDKYHLYWQLERGSDLDVWRELQLGMASKLNGDLQLSLPTSMIRVPGFLRLNKDGKKEYANVLAFRDENPVKPLSIKEIVKMWPWIWEESAKGEMQLRKQRSEAAKIARELMRQRGKDYDSVKFAKLTPDAGRNNTLYLSVYDIVYSHPDKLDEASALSFGEDINKAFINPLGAAEVEKTVLSAWKHGIRARTKRIRDKLKLVNVLSKSGTSGASSTGAQQQKEKTPSTSEISASLNDTVVSTLFGGLNGKAELPETYLDISDLLVANIWTSEALEEKSKRVHHNIFAAAHVAKYYKALGDFLLKSMHQTGIFTVSGYSTYLKGKNEAGEEIRYRTNLDADQTAALLHDIVSSVYLHIMQDGLRSKSKSAKKAAKAAKSNGHLGNVSNVSNVSNVGASNESHRGKKAGHSVAGNGIGKGKKGKKEIKKEQKERHQVRANRSTEL